MNKGYNSINLKVGLPVLEIRSPKALLEYGNKRPHKKRFNAVEFIRKRKEASSKETEGMTPDEELQFFAEKYVEYERKKKK